jgi:hypothetical protein
MRTLIRIYSTGTRLCSSEETGKLLKNRFSVTDDEDLWAELAFIHANAKDEEEIERKIDLNASLS